MPFPFSKLPYGCRNRLRELSTRQEAYDFQIAVGNDITGLLPIVMPQLISSCNIDGDNPEILSIGFFSVYDPEIINIADIPSNFLYYVEYSMKLEATTEDVLKNPIFDKLYLKRCEELAIFSKVSPKLLQKLSERMSPTILELYDANMESSISEIFSLFPMIQHFAYSKFYNGWARDLASVANNGTVFHSWDIDAKMMDIITFDSEDIVKLLKNNCTIVVDCTFPEDLRMKKAFSKVKEKLGPKFKVNNRSHSPCFVITLRSVSESAPCKQKRFVLRK
uniref:FBD domain-containing protein n=1 Tax=Panagrellus redivivus TaxID=6233 RepID=A0A7E4W9V3_PANRE